MHPNQEQLQEHQTGKAHQNQEEPQEHQMQELQEEHQTQCQEHQTVELLQMEEVVEEHQIQSQELPLRWHQMGRLPSALSNPSSGCGRCCSVGDRYTSQLE